MTDGSVDKVALERARVGGFWAEIAIAIAITAGLVVFLAATFGETSAFAQASSGRGPFFFPRFVLGAMFLAVPFLFLGARHNVRALPPAGPLARMGLLILATAGYCALIGVLGFLIASVLFAVLVPLLLGRRDPVTIVLVAVVYSAAVWALFEKVFLIILPASPWDIGF